MTVQEPIVRITDSPLTGLARYAELIKLEWNLFLKEVKIELVIFYQDTEGNNIKGEGISDYRRLLVAKNDYLVDPATGILADENTVNPIGEYDFYTSMLTNQIDILALIQAAVLAADGSERNTLN